MNVSTIRLELEIEINRYYSYLLRNCLHDDNHPISDHFDYVWSRIGKPNITIPFTRRGVNIDIEPDGITTTNDNQIKNNTNWKCGERFVPILPLNPRYLFSLNIEFTVIHNSSSLSIFIKT